MLVLGRRVGHERSSFSFDDRNPCIVIYFGIDTRPNDSTCIPTGLFSAQGLPRWLRQLDLPQLLINSVIRRVYVARITRPGRHVRVPSFLLVAILATMCRFHGVDHTLLDARLHKLV